MKRPLELLAPAKNLACGLGAISHGADAVYIGASRFGARAAAGNSLDDIRMLVDYAHQFGAKVYVTVNTIIYEEELSDTQALITDLARIGVDALLVQDMATLEMRRVALQQVGHAPVLHASTQCDTRTAEKVRWFRSLGFTRVVLARELSLDEIRAIHEAEPSLELEVFVHGALCVSYSGICYASQHCFQRSANRGECAQFCRMKFDLLDADGKTIEHNRHLLSMKDLCQIDHLEDLADAGASSFKIEGRLKDVDYVKNVVAAYSQRLDEIIAKRPDRYCRSSHGKVEYRFTPDLKKTFNRGFTTYFLNGRQPDIASFDTPKALGEYVGHVKELRRDSFNVAGTAAFANGDGLCFINDDQELEGFRVNRAVGNRLYPFKMPRNLRPGQALYRNNDVAFEKILAGDTAARKIPVVMTFSAIAEGFQLEVTCQDVSASAIVRFDHQSAKRPQGENIRKQLSKLGNTPYDCLEVNIANGADEFFIPSSLLSELRRNAVESFAKAFAEAVNAKVFVEAVSEKPLDMGSSEEASKTMARPWQREYSEFPYTFNIANHLAREFYEKQGLTVIHPAFELSRNTNHYNSKGRVVVMQCRHCIRYALGYCVRRGGKKPTWHEPLTLRLGDGRRFRLDFRCDECQMNLLSL